MRFLLGLVLATALAAAGCARPAAAPVSASVADTAARVLAFHGHAQALSAELLLRIKPPQQDAVTITAHVWVHTDGRVRMNASKLDVTFCQALIEADGSCTAWLPRAKLVTRTPAAADGRKLPPFLSDLQLMASELRDGPLLPSVYVSNSSVPPLLRQPNRDGSILVQVNSDGSAALKKFLDAADGERLTLVYSNYKTFETLRRASLVQMQTPNDLTDVRISVRALEELPAISNERLRLNVPADAVAVDIDTFIDHLGD